MNPAKTIQNNPLKFADDNIFPLWMNKDRTIELNPRKIQNDPILPNPAKSFRKNFSEFADDPITSLYTQVLRRNNIKIPFLTWRSSSSSSVTQNAIAHVS